MNYDDYCRYQVKAISPKIRPCEDPSIPPPLQLSPTSEAVEVPPAKDSEPLLTVLIQQNHRQAQEIKALKEELRVLSLKYEELQSRNSPLARKGSILDQALALRSRSSSIAEGAQDAS
eukprot:CAMPEP_0204906304 /NCGR_PEP_ID=MMETSP1397-20131031/5906_1 /ASSEMBLY_ACC=CAM_ASM_000891 /TAXON_ID=49980 /ORGANISM="Climacostomum Climacostomum virens, Strain Stock W-24" /LENGTH=117 /DNA_ID=CAMNT_0052075291 /DNA_START=442 /DNA_END=795 /DNA_ORIENTATION=-